MGSKCLGPLEQVEEHYSESHTGLTSLEGVFLQYFFQAMRQGAILALFRIQLGRLHSTTEDTLHMTSSTDRAGFGAGRSKVKMVTSLPQPSLYRARPVQR